MFIRFANILGGAIVLTREICKQHVPLIMPVTIINSLLKYSDSVQQQQALSAWHDNDHVCIVRRRSQKIWKPKTDGSRAGAAESCKRRTAEPRKDGKAQKKHTACKAAQYEKAQQKAAKDATQRRQQSQGADGIATTRSVLIGFTATNTSL